VENYFLIVLVMKQCRFLGAFSRYSGKLCLHL